MEKTQSQRTHGQLLCSTCPDEKSHCLLNTRLSALFLIPRGPLCKSTNDSLSATVVHGPLHHGNVQPTVINVTWRQLQLFLCINQKYQQLSVRPISRHHLRMLTAIAREPNNEDNFTLTTSACVCNYHCSYNTTSLDTSVTDHYHYHLTTHPHANPVMSQN
jgi:hypothetical protein